MSNLIAVSTWSLHRLLGISHPNGPGDADGGAAQPTWGAGACRLDELPAELAKRGYSRAEICHFHLASLEKGYLREIGKAFANSGVVIQTLLIDDGDLTNPASFERDKAWIARWIEAAAELGAEHARVIAGKSKPDAATLAMSVAGLREMGHLGRSLGVRVVTENWFDLLASPKEVRHVLGLLDFGVGFLADTGNWHGASKYSDLESIFARAELCHAKCSFAPGFVMDRVDFGLCIEASQRVAYEGPYTLIYDGPEDDEWAALAMERDFLRDKMSAKGS